MTLAFARTGAMRRGWRFHPRRFFILLTLVVACAADDHQVLSAVSPSAALGLGSWLARLPEMPPTPIALTAPLEDLRSLGDGVAIRLAAPAQVSLNGWLVRNSGPDGHGLEILVCLSGGRTHESMVCTNSGDALLIKQAFLAAFAWPDGQGANEASLQPVRGVPVTVEIAWRDRQGLRRALPASCAVRDHVTGRAFPPLPYIYTGSRLVPTMMSTPDGGTIPVTSFLLAESRTLVANNDDGGELIGSPLPQDADQMRYEVAPGVLPPPDTPVELVFGRAELPLTLHRTAEGGLADTGGVTLDDAALAERLRVAFASASPTTLRAVAIAVSPSVSRAGDATIAGRLFAAAVQARVWCLPIFTLADR